MVVLLTRRHYSRTCWEPEEVMDRKERKHLARVYVRLKSGRDVLQVGNGQALRYAHGMRNEISASKLCSTKWLYKQSQFHRLLAMSWNHGFIVKSTTATKYVREPLQSNVHLVAQPVGLCHSKQWLTSGRMMRLKALHHVGVALLFSPRQDILKQFHKKAVRGSL